MSEPPHAKTQFGALIGHSAVMRRVFETIRNTSRVDVPVLITGETGTGKELVAREIHQRSRRRKGPFIAVNTGSLPRELVAGELFGHMKGAFTGADQRRSGRFLEADKGTLFLDEIGSMEESVQVTLLRVLETRRFRPLGSRREIPTDIRIISATNLDLRRAIREGTFRQDLLQRLEVLHIALPPLRKRRGDIPLLVEYYLELFRQQFETVATSVSSETLRCLQEYRWPGNIRELKNALLQAAVSSEEAILLPIHLPVRIADSSNMRPSIPGKRKSGVGNTREIAREQRTHSPSPGESMLSLLQGNNLVLPLGLTLDEVERAYTLRTLASCGNNKTLAAKKLGITRKTLYERLKRWGLKD